MQNTQVTQKYSSVRGRDLKRTIIASRWRKEQVVAHVQDKGLGFSLAGLDRLYRGESIEDRDEILEAIAEKCGCSTLDFAELEDKAS